MIIQFDFLYSFNVTRIIPIRSIFLQSVVLTFGRATNEEEKYNDFTISFQPVLGTMTKKSTTVSPIPSNPCLKTKIKSKGGTYYNK